jgi:tetratricopeptide (TPR) repeat protein
LAAKSKANSGNDHALAELRAVLASEQAIAFVGAGTSAGYYPLWGQLLRILADAAVNLGLALPSERKSWMAAGARPQHVAQAIKRKLGDSIYGQIIFETFRPTTGPDGNRFSPAHSALMELPFRGYVTTNYDPGLIEARLASAIGIPATAYSTWRDKDHVQRWYTGDIFSEYIRPILFAHGIYERSDTIVLAAEEYHTAYDSSAYRLLFDNLWGRERLVFVGFGFSDPWLDYLTQSIVRRTAGPSAGRPRHVALIGLRNKEKRQAEERRREFQEEYNASIYFYDIVRSESGDDDHSDLIRVLRSLVSVPSPDPTAKEPVTAKLPVGSRIPQCWVHETTDDDFYVGRTDSFRRLDCWAADQNVRLIAVTGLGGLGKTSLVGRWIKHAGGDAWRNFDGVFFWSFYGDRSVRAFLNALLAFAAKEFKFDLAKHTDATLAAAKTLLRSASLLIVLDGLEILQEGPGSNAYGTLLEHDLREFLIAACQAEHRSLVVITSRFPFPDLTRYLGAELRCLALDMLNAEEGSALLARCGVGGTGDARQIVVRKFEGHPLALRVFAAVLATQADGDPTRLLQVVFHRDHLRSDEPLQGKICRLLAFYEEHLPPYLRGLLCLVSLFRLPVDQKTLKTLARKLPATKDVLGKVPASTIRQHLSQLHRDHLLLRDSGGTEGHTYSCHPILRDHFRASLLGRDKSAANGVADLLEDRPASERPSDLDQIEPVLSAIDLLLEAGNFKRADELYKGRLHGGYVFRWLPAPHEGLRCALGFVAGLRRGQCEADLGRQGLSYYLNAAGLHGSLAGELSLAVAFFKDAEAIKARGVAVSNLLYGLQNSAWALIKLGRLAEATSAARDAKFLSQHDRHADAMINSLTCHAHALAMMGDVGEANAMFTQANSIQTRSDPQKRELFGLGAVWWADLLIRAGLYAKASRLAKTTLLVSRSEGWLDDIARCEWLLGRCFTAQGNREAAQEQLSRAEATMRRAHMLAELPEVLLAQAELFRVQNAWKEALIRADESFELSRLRDMIPTHADSLVARGRYTLARAQDGAETVGASVGMQLRMAQDDAETALDLSRGCGYQWAERDALLLRADTCDALAEVQRSIEMRHAADALTQRLTLKEGQGEESEPSTS